MGFLRFLLRLIGFSPKPHTAAEIKEQQMIEFNRKRNIIMTAVGAAQQNQTQAQGQGQAQVVGDGKGAPAPGSQTIGEALKKSAQEHEQTAVIGKSKGGKPGWKQRTTRSRAIGKRTRRRKERALSLWR